MSFKRVTGLFGIFAVVCIASRAFASDPPPPVIDSVNAGGNTKNLRFTPYPGAQTYTFYSASNVAGPFVVNTNFVLSPYITGYITNIISNAPVVLTNLSFEWRLTNITAPSGFYKLSATALNSNAVLTVTVLNRLAYGPTPDELERIGTNAQAYIDEQVNMSGIPETLDTYVTETINAAPYDPATNWIYVTLTGSQSSTNLLMYLTQAGDVYVDDIQLVVGTNAGAGPNLISNGDFESALTPPWTVSANHSGSAIVTGPAHSGNNCLHVVASSAGSSQGTSIWQGFVPTQTNGSLSKLTLSYWMLPNANSGKLTFRLSTQNSTSLLGSGAGLPQTPRWVYATATGTASTLSRLYYYLNAAGESYLDDVKLVAGSVPESGANLVANGDFESALSPPWTFGTRYVTNSAISSTTSHSGNGSLHIVGTGVGSTNNGIYEVITPSLTSGQTYTLSYWYYPVTSGATLTAKLFGSSQSNLLSNPDTDPGGLYRRLGTIGQANVADLRAWFCLHAVNSPRQLLEVLSQFWENHFVTQWSKSRDYLNGKGYDNTTADYLAAEWEFREMIKWRNAMLNPNCTFYDLLRISAESPAQIVYLDTVDSKGSGNNIANENYARELLELFTCGVDNGYDQNDIVQMSRAWTGWSVELVDPPNATNVFAPASLTYYPNTNGNSKPNTIGVWAFNYKAGSHGTNRGAIFPGKYVPARFGSPWAGTNYQISIPARTGNAGIQDGYDVITNLANLPFTQEFISVKLCRLFVHDDFPNPTTKTGTVEYAFYDYTNPNRSAEAELVHQCMLTWQNSTPKGNIRSVLSTIFNSDLFRSHTASAQKIKTPFEFVASSVRSLLSTNPVGQVTATTDGYSFATQLDRMGTMGLFDRAAPDGYPEAGPPWISAGTLAERIRYVQAFCMTNGASGRDDAGKNFSDPVGVLKMKLPAGLNDANAVADYFLGILFPAEGAANLAPYRSACVKYLNTADDGSASLFSGLGNTSGTYENRVRGMVAMLLTSKRFQEQ